MATFDDDTIVLSPSSPYSSHHHHPPPTLTILRPPSPSSSHPHHSPPTLIILLPPSPSSSHPHHLPPISFSCPECARRPSIPRPGMCDIPPQLTFLLIRRSLSGFYLEVLIPLPMLYAL